MKKEKPTTQISTKQEKAKPSVSVKSSAAKPKKPAVAATKTATAKVTKKTEQQPDINPVVVTEGIKMSELIGMAAGSIWHYLDKNGATTVAKLIQALPEDEKIIQRGIGWLAKENKITLSIVDRAETITLVS